MTWMMVAQAQSTVNTINLDGSKLEKDVTKGTLICASTMNLSLLQQINCIFSQRRMSYTIVVCTIIFQVFVKSFSGVPADERLHWRSFLVILRSVYIVYTVLRDVSIYVVGKDE
ncbi:hypothetical protein T459_02912 [Capsicum annuum]|uniref:Uncharacterized protein n=1 Tax=Capsicum annuum TaxID=4072 RepID=A0A2G3ALE2_CAPAN|nr:hypothetical protein T459_02912 [Capsicum annuum]